MSDTTPSLPAADEYESLGRRIIDRAESRLAQLRDAHTRNSLLSGEALRGAARGLVAASDGMLVMAADEAGERVIGAALAMSDRLALVDQSAVVRGQAVVLVSGYTAGDVGRARAVSVAHSQGAVHIELAALSICSEIPGCDKVTLIGAGEPADVDLAAEFDALGWRKVAQRTGSYFRYVAPNTVWTVESVVVPLDESATDFEELHDYAVRVLQVARATACVVATAETIFSPDAHTGAKT